MTSQTLAKSVLTSHIPWIKINWIPEIRSDNYPQLNTRQTGCKTKRVKRLNMKGGQGEYYRQVTPQ